MALVTHGELAADELTRAVNGDAWHGPSLRELVSSIPFEEAMQHPIPTAHSIWEIVLHITSWANIALRRITGGEVEPREGEDWPVVGEMTSARWDEAREELALSHQRLCEMVMTLTDDEILAKAPKSPNSVAVMLHGVAQHGAYHGGQIAILKKVVTIHHRRMAV
jgi:uncharacterized damage-inducible protein DinB